MKRTRVNDINGDCKENSCLISPVCTIWKTNTASKVLIAAASSLSLERWRGQAPQTTARLWRLPGECSSLSEEKRGASHLGFLVCWLRAVDIEPGAFSSLQLVVGVTWNQPQGTHSQNNFPKWMQGERVRVEKVCGWPTCSWVPAHSLCLWRFIFSYIHHQLSQLQS